ncbi:MAG: FliA/WhiG family RNA polymerase sigma factor [Candidatus Gastranaerophilales bacterium]|nr:FliA/WhiG family RNA polymerase sigma factor [Candidatus Gastranaerophilales bacterium]
MDSVNQIHLSEKKIKKLTEAELEALWIEYIKDKSNKKAKDTLVVQYIYLIKYVVGRMRVSLPSSIASEDIASFGIEGLINAIERYSLDKNTRFETYALTRIRGEIIDKIREQDWVPRAVRRKQKEINAVIQIMQKELKRPPTEEELAQRMEMPIQKIREIIKEAGSDIVISLNATRDASDQSSEIIDNIEDTKSINPLDKLEEKDAKKDLIRGLSKLPERERVVLTLYYNQNMTFKEIGEALKISESRACQVHAQSIMKLRNILTSNKLELRKIVE